MLQMSPRERVSTALSIQKPDRVTKDAWFTPRILEEFQKQTGADDPAEYYGFEYRMVTLGATKVSYDFSKYLSDDLPSNASVSEWGEANIPGDFYHFTRYVQPLASLMTGYPGAEIQGSMFPRFGCD